MTEPNCSDCGFPVRGVTPEKIAKGSSVREPGEPVCANCSAKRTKMVRDLKQIPSNLHEIRMKRRVKR